MGGSGKFTVRVVTESCQGHNRCYSIAPGLFEVDEFGTARARGDGSVSDALLEKARLAVKNCPEHAVRLEPAK